MINFYNAADNALYKQANSQFLPQDRFRGSVAPVPPELIEEENVTETFGIPNTETFKSMDNGGNNFSVYNSNPDSLPSYRPNYDYRQFSEYGSNPSTADIKQMDMNQEYFNAPPPSKLEGLAGMLPGVGPLIRGAKFLGNQLGPYLPANKRAIMENELAGKGVMVNDIGQIVQGGGAYDTASNVMAGYNANKMTVDTFNNRLDKIAETMGKKGYKGNLQTRVGAIEAAKADFLNAQGKSDKIYDFEEEEKKRKKKDNIISRFFKKKKAADAKTTTGGTTGTTGTTTGGTTGTTTGGGSGGTVPTTSPNYTPVGPNQPDPYSYTAPTYSGMDSIGSGGNGGGDRPDNSGGGGFSNPGKGSYGPHFARGGRIGYYFGGLAARGMKK